MVSPKYTNLRSPSDLLYVHRIAILLPLQVHHLPHIPPGGKTSTHAKHSKHFLEALQDVRVAEDELLVSFNVPSLSTNVPLNEAVQVIQHKLEQDDTLANRTTLSANKVAELLNVCLRSTYFSYGGDFYEQREGAAMGSPVSAAVANLYMEYFQDLALSQAPADCVPCIWKRYVDDTFCILKKGAVEELLSHLNSL